MSEPVHSGLHPDADSLNAFIEGALPEHERAQCLAHLAECEDCREIVYLTQPPVADIASVRSRKPWFLPVSAFAALAGMLILGVGIYRVLQPVTPPPQQARTEPSSVPAPPAPPTLKTEPEPVKAAPPAQPARNRAAAVPLVPGKKQTVEIAAAPPLPSPAVTVQAQDALLATESGAQSAPAVTPLAQLPLRGAAPPVMSGLTGTVTDAAGGAIPRADVNLRGLAGGDTHAVNTDSTGQFSFAGLAPGRYEMQIFAPGFVRTAKEVDLAPQQVAKADSVLSVGAVNESVTVTAESPRLNTRSALAGVRSARQAPATPPDPSSFTLPNRQRAAITATRDSIVLAADPAGALFVSRNAGKSWKAVKGKWHGKVISLVTPPGNAVFQLTTDSGSVWVSQDGNRWDPVAPAK